MRYEYKTFTNRFVTTFKTKKNVCGIITPINNNQDTISLTNYAKDTYIFVDTHKTLINASDMFMNAYYNIWTAERRLFNILQTLYLYVFWFSEEPKMQM